MLFLMITGHQLLFFFLDPSFYSIPNTTIGAFLQGLFQSLNLSPVGRYLSP
jgi:flagellar biosynthesis protein FliR